MRRILVVSSVAVLAVLAVLAVMSTAAFAAPARPAGMRELQQQLTDLGFWLGDVDGQYGPLTRQAVTALQKAAGVGRDGVAGPVTLAALSRAERVRPRSTRGHMIEVDLIRQLVIVADSGRATWVLDASTGVVPGSTPTGRFRVFRQVDGEDVGPFGPLHRPKYFVGGVALHGYGEVPAMPASHGCVRVPLAAMDMLWGTGLVPVGSAVWVY